MSGYDYDVAIVGSGFGGSVSALRLTEKGYRVCVLEAGRRFGPTDFPRTNWNLKRFLFAPKLGLRGIQRLTLLDDVLVLSGAGVGGGSLVYANTLYEPLEAFYTDPRWSEVCDWRGELAPHYRQARAMLGVTTAPDDSPNDAVIRAIGEKLGVADTYRPTQVGVYFGEPGRVEDDPYFGGAGPARTGCIKCGGCMVGCRHDAKNTLDKNYLYLAEANGATVLPNRQVVDLVARSESGYDVVSVRSGSWRQTGRQVISAEQVVFSAGVLGTVKLLAELRERGRLPGCRGGSVSWCAPTPNPSPELSHAREPVLTTHREWQSAHRSIPTITPTSRVSAIRRDRTRWPCWRPCSSTAGDGYHGRCVSRVRCSATHCGFFGASRCGVGRNAR